MAGKDFIIKIVETFFIILMFALFFLCGIMYQQDQYNDKYMLKIDMDKYILKLDSDKYMLKPVPIIIAENLHKESEYNIHNWDCSNKTEENIVRMHQQGYSDARYVGVKYNDGCHAIMCYTAFSETTQPDFINININNNYSSDRTGCRNITDRD